MNAATPETAAFVDVPVKAPAATVQAESVYAAKVTEFVAVVNTAPNWSFTETEGCVANATPDIAVADGWVVNARDVATGGTALTVTSVEPETAPLVALTVVVPAASAVNIPVVGFIVPAAVLELDHVTVAVMGAPYWSRVVAVNCWVLPAVIVGVRGETVIVVRTGGADTTIALLQAGVSPELDAPMYIVAAAG